MSERELSRRKFLMGAAAAGSLLAGGCARGGRQAALGGTPLYAPAREKLRIAKVGCGGMGASDLRGFSDQEIVALCDVDEVRAAAAYKLYPDVPKFRDYRKMFDAMENQIDAVAVTTPDHTHAVIALEAIRRGKHVYVQKPLTYTVHEARVLRAAARRHGVMTQMGNQGHAQEGVRLTSEWIWGGAIGPVREVQMWTDRPGKYWTQGADKARPAGQPLPSTMEWDVWLGPAPYREYNEAYAPFKWRGWWDFGTGVIGDMACHLMDTPFFALRIDEAETIKVSAQTAPFNEESYPEWSIITYEVPARADMPPVKLVWYDGGKLPERPADLEAGRDMGANSQLYIGDGGKLLAGVYGEGPRLIPESKMEDWLETKREQQLWRSPGVYREFVEACKGGPVPGSNFEYSTPLTEVALLGNVAIRTGEAVEYNFKTGRITNNAAANQWLTREYRKGWEI